MRVALALLEDVFKVRPNEVRRTAFAFLYLFTAIGAFMTSRVVKSTLFLEIPNYREQLPLTFIGIAIFVSAIMTTYSRYERRLRRDQTNTITLIVVVLITVGFRFALDADRSSGFILDNPRHEIYWAFLIWVEVFGTMLIVQFWSMMPEIFNSREAKRLFALIAGGGVLGSITFGGLVRTLTGGDEPMLGTEDLMFVIAGCMAFSCVMVQLLAREAKEALIAAKERSPSKKRAPAAANAPKPKQVKVFTARHVQLIALVVVLTYLVSTMVEYQFNVVVGNEIAGKEARSAYFAAFFFWAGIVGAVIQYTLTARILERFGILFALLLLPICMLGGTFALVSGFAAVLYAATVAKGSEVALRYTINDSTLQLLYIPVPTEIRGRAKTIIDGILKPVSMGFAGFILALLVGQTEKLIGLSLGFTLGVAEIGYVVAFFLLCWMAALVWLRREYLKSLMQTLQRRRLNFADSQFQIADEGTIKTLHDALSANNVGHVMHALELLPHVTDKARKPLNEKVVELLPHEAHEVRVSALNYLANEDREDRQEVDDLLDDSSRDVRAAAVLAYCSARREHAILRVHDMLLDCDRKVQAAAVAGLMRYGGFDGVLASADHLKLWLNSTDELDRVHSAWVLGEIGVQNFYQPLIPLLADDSERVRQEAINAAGRLTNAELINPLIAQLKRPRLAGAAITALVAFGSSIADKVAEVLADPEREPATRTQACRILARLGDSHSVEILNRHILDEDATVRGGVVQALVAIAGRNSEIRVDAKTVAEAIRTECESWFENLALTMDLQLNADSVLLSDALEHRKGMALTQILALLSLKYSRETIHLVSNNLKSNRADTRANAVEVLDNHLDRDEKAMIIPILDDASAEKTLQSVAEVFEITRSSRNMRLEVMLASADPWLQTCAAIEVGKHRIKSLEPQIRELLKSKNSICRETAVGVLSQIVAAENLCKRVGDMVNDSARHVARYAEFVLAEAAPATPEATQPGA